MAENYISCQDDRGSINISEDVIISMVRAAINEVEGVAALTQPAASELAELLGIKSASKGLKVQFVALRFQCGQCCPAGAGRRDSRDRIHDRNG